MFRGTKYLGRAIDQFIEKESDGGGMRDGTEEEEDESNLFFLSMRERERKRARIRRSRSGERCRGFYKRDTRGWIVPLASPLSSCAS